MFRYQKNLFKQSNHRSRIYENAYKYNPARDIIDQYNLENLKYDKGWCYMRIDKEMYGLK